MKVGLVGCGEISQTHIDAWLSSKKCDVVSVCDLVKSRADDLAKKNKIPRVYTDFSLMLQKENLDIVDVTTNPQVHAPLTIEAIEAGCHVLTEKPMCMTVKEADQMIATAKRNNRKLGLIHSFLFTPGIQKALKQVRQGEIGDLLWVDTVISIKSLLDWVNAPGFPQWYSKLPGGIFGEIIPHGLYVTLAFLGSPIQTLAMTRKVQDADALIPFSQLQVLMNCEKGLGGLDMFTNINTPHTILMTRIVGTQRILLVTVPTGTVLEMKTDRSRSAFARARTNLDLASQLVSSDASLAARRLFGSTKQEMTHKIIVNKFVESVQTGSEPAVTAEEGREVVKATEMIWKNLS